MAFRLSSLVLALSLLSKASSLSWAVNSPVVNNVKRFVNLGSRLRLLLNRETDDKDESKDILEPKVVTHVPTAEQTNGIDPYFTRLCAQVASNIYKKPLDISSFDNLADLPDNGGLKRPPKVVLYDNNEPFTTFNPPFVAVVAGDKLILAWRGTQSVMDAVRDFSMYLGASYRWKSLAKVVKVQAGVLALVESTFVVHEDEILKIIEDYGIKEILVTGHSLGGGTAQVAKLWLEASMDVNVSQSSAWHKLAEKGLTVRSLSIEGPATTLYAESADEELNQKGIDFINKCAENMCTTVFMQDPVPRCNNNIEGFGMDALENAIDDLEKNKGHLIGPLRYFVNVKLLDRPHELIESIFPVINKYQHLGNVLHYEYPAAEPKVYIDNKNAILIDKKGNTPQFGDMKYVPFDKDVFNTLSLEHMYLVSAPGLAFI